MEWEQEMRGGERKEEKDLMGKMELKENREIKLL